MTDIEFLLDEPGRAVVVIDGAAVEVDVVDGYMPPEDGHAVVAVD